MINRPPNRLRRIIQRRLDEIETVANILGYDMPNKDELVEDLLAEQLQNPETAAMLWPLRRRPSWWN
ncbi:MAG: hypothetical protein M1347_02920 [Chloroflexi bacterium]|nr:hypothetical protein [Chloroflexota bacterium]